jgi:excisionase family DNA binding protein
VTEAKGAPMARRPWSAADLSYVVENRDRMSARAIGARLGRSERSVHHLLSKLRYRKRRRLTSAPSMSKVAEPQKKWRRWVSTQRFDLEVMAVRGNVRTLSARLGRSYWATHKALHRAGLNAGMVDGMMSLMEVARTYDCSRERVERLIRDGLLPASKPGAFWRIDPAEVEGVAALLRERSKFAPKRRAG